MFGIFAAKEIQVLKRLTRVSEGLQLCSPDEGGHAFVPLVWRSQPRECLGVRPILLWQRKFALRQNTMLKRVWRAGCWDAFCIHICLFTYVTYTCISQFPRGRLQMNLHVSDQLFSLFWIRFSLFCATPVELSLEHEIKGCMRDRNQGTGY